MLLSMVIQSHQTVYNYEVCHVDNEGTYRESEVPYVSAADALTVKDAMMVQIIDADVA